MSGAFCIVNLNTFGLVSAKLEGLLTRNDGPAYLVFRPAANNNGYFIATAVKTGHGCSIHTMFGALELIFASRRRSFCLVDLEVLFHSHGIGQTS